MDKFRFNNQTHEVHIAHGNAYLYFAHYNQCGITSNMRDATKTRLADELEIERQDTDVDWDNND